MIAPIIFLAKEQVAEICRQLAKDISQQWFKKRGINVSTKGAYCLLSKDYSSELNHWNVLTNSLLVKNYEPISVPWFSFYKLNDKNCTIDFENCHLIENLESTQIHVFFPNRSSRRYDLTVHTDEGLSGVDKTAEEFLSLVEKLKFNMQDFPYTSTFQYDSHLNLSLVSRRFLKTLWEEKEDDLDYLADKLGAARPKRIHIKKGLDDIKEKIKEDVEKNKEVKSWIVRDCVTGVRAEVHFSVQRPKLVSTCRWKHLIPYWFDGEEWLVKSQFPQSISKYQEIEQKVKQKINLVYDEAIKWRQKGLMQQALFEALKASELPAWMHKSIMSLQTSHKERWRELIRNDLTKVGLRTFMDILDLKDDE